MHINKEGRAGRCAGSEERGNAFVSGRLMVKRPPAILPPLTGVSLTITITRRAFLRVGEEGTVGYGLAKVIRNSRARFRTVESSYDYVPSRGEKWSSCIHVSEARSPLVPRRKQISFNRARRSNRRSVVREQRGTWRPQKTLVRSANERFNSRKFAGVVRNESKFRRKRGRGQFKAV